MFYAQESLADCYFFQVSHLLTRASLLSYSIEAELVFCLINHYVLITDGSEIAASF